MRECQIRHESRDGVDVLHLDGALDAYAFPRLETALNHLRETGRHKIVLHCASLDYVNSAALGALIGFARKSREQGGDLKLACLTPKIYNIVELLGFDKILHIHPEIQMALDAFPQA